MPEPKTAVDAGSAPISGNPTHVPSTKPVGSQRTEVPHRTRTWPSPISAIQANAGSAAEGSNENLMASDTVPNDTHGLDSGLVAAPYAVFRSLPDPWRGWLSLRSTRRWLRATRFAARHNRRVAADVLGFNFHPMRPEPNMSIAHVMRRLGVRIQFGPAETGVNLAWDTGTWFSPKAARQLPASAINARCLDISKTTVDRIWSEVAGYTIAVDPLTTVGPLVEKPDENGRRGGRVVQGPLNSRKAGTVYQRLVDTRVGDRVLQIRPVILCGEIVLVYEKWREFPYWFQAAELTVPKTVRDFFSEEQQAQLLRFADAIGLDYGELDVVRDEATRLIYVVDANRTPMRPKGLPDESEDAAFGPQAEAFRALLSR